MPLTTRRNPSAKTTQKTESFLPTALRTRLENEKKEIADRAAATSGYVAVPKDGESVEFRVMSQCRWGFEIWYEYKDDEDNTRKSVTRWDAETLSELGLDDVPTLEIPEGFAVRKTGDPDLKTFMAMIVWNYKEEKFQIWSFVQQSLRDQFQKACENPRYGDPRGYDFEWSRTGKIMTDTVHTLMALPPEPISDEIAEAFENFNCDLLAHCQGAPGSVVFGKKAEN
jgi:hypothetical protein